MFVLIVLREIKINAFKRALLYLESSVASVHLLGRLIIEETISSYLNYKEKIIMNPLAMNLKHEPQLNVIVSCKITKDQNTQK